MTSTSITIPKRRVKVYELSDDGSWMDRGTGHILPLMQPNDIPALVVISEENQQQILYSRIYKEYIFRRQQETLILWTDQKNIELALSFQESAGCYEVWNEIATIQKDLPLSGNIPNDDYYDSDFISLPEPTIANLEEIENTINQASRSIFSKDHLAQYVISEHYIDKLIPLLEDCEDLDSTEDLYRLSAIMKAIIYLNDNIIYHHILQDDIILGVVGMLEHKQFLKNLFEILNDKTNSIDKRKQVIMFLHELCSVTKGLQYVYRDIFYKSLTEYGLLSIVEELAYHDDISIRLALISMLTNMLDHETALVRNYCINQMKKDGKPLIESIIDRFHSDPDSGIRSQYMDILRILLDTSTLDPNESITTTIQNKPEVDEFLDLFYEIYINLLVKPITDLTEKDIKINKRGKSELYASYDKNSTFFMICELLCFCIKNHSYRCKFFILKSTITEKICLLLKSNEKYIRLSALRYFRACISMKDEFYNKHLIKNSVFKPIIQMLVETERRNNLLNSACLELFVFIKKENIKSLIVHIVSNYREILEGFDYVNVFKLLIARYEQYQDNNSETQNNDTTTSKLTMSSTNVNDWGKADEEEEAYFNDDDDDEEDSILENRTEKSTEDSNKNDKSERNINPRISLSNSVNGPSRGRIANPKAIVARFIRSTQPLASGLVDYPDDDDIIEEEDNDEDEEMIPKPNMKSTLNDKNDNKTNENTSNINGSASSIGKYSLSNGKIRKIEFVSEKDKNKNENKNKNEKKEKGKEEKDKNKKSDNKKVNNIINKNNMNEDNNKEMTTANDSIDKSNDNNKRSREEEEEDHSDDEPLPIRKKVNKEDDDEIFLKSINRNKLKKEANKLNSNEKLPLNSKKITLNISPKLKHTEITSTLSSTSPSLSPSSSPSSNPTPTSPQKKINVNAMDEDEKESNTTIITPIINNNNSEEDKISSIQDNKKKVDIIINPNLKNLKKS